jgi:hypothetical protein
VKDDERVDLEKEIVGKEIERESGKDVGQGESTLNPSEPVPSTPKETLSTRMKEADSVIGFIIFITITIVNDRCSYPSDFGKEDVDVEVVPERHFVGFDQEVGGTS